MIDKIVISALIYFIYSLAYSEILRYLMITVSFINCCVKLK